MLNSKNWKSWPKSDPYLEGDRTLPLHVRLIAIVDEGNALGENQNIPWEVPSAERKLFRKLTLNSPVIMGRKTYESIGHALADRPNIVVSKTLQTLPDAIVVSTIEAALKEAHSYGSHTSIIGGQSLYTYVLEQNIADTMYLSVVPGHHNADTFFPEFDKNLWHCATIQRFSDFIFYVYKKL